MNIMVLILILAFSLCGSLYAHAQEPVSYDGSKSKEAEVVWVRQTGLTSMGSYIRDVADIPGNNVVTLLANGVYRTWPTRPTLDTTSTEVQWIGGRASGFAGSLDYDGLLPTEFFSGNKVYRSSLDGKIMTAIDTITCMGSGPFQVSPGRYMVDVDNDGLLDIVTDYYGGANLYGVIMNGPGRTDGCDKLLMLPNPFKNLPSPERPLVAMRLMRCADGQLRFVVVGSFHWQKSGIYLFDVHLQQTDTGYVVSYTTADSVEQTYIHIETQPRPWIVGRLLCVDDAKNRHQYALVNWEDGYHRNHNTTVMYEVSNGKLVERVSTNGTWLNQGIKTYDNAFDDGPAIISYGHDGAHQFARIDEFYRPFAHVTNADLLDPYMAFIDDQFGDGSRDIFSAVQGRSHIALINFDLRPTSVAEGSDTEHSWVQLDAGRLRFTLEHASPITVDLVNAVGQKQTIITSFNPGAGASSLDISQELQALPKGAWFVRVSDCIRMVSLTYLR